MSTTYRVGIIGTGGIAGWHAEYYQAHPQTEIVSGADLNPERLQAFCDAHHIPARFADHRELLADDCPDIVSICTWSGTHSEIGIAAAEAGCQGIICEKPMAETLSDACDMLVAAEENGAKLAIHHQTRCSPVHTAVREALAAGLIGQPLLIHRRVSDGLLNSGSHALDAVLYILGDPQATWVLGQAGRTTDRHERGTPIEDLCAAIVAFPDGTRLVLESDLPAPHLGSWSFVHGAEGLIRFNAEEAFVLSSARTPDTRVGPAGDWAPLTLTPQPGYLEEFIAWLEGGPDHRCSGRRSRGAQELMMALYASARDREPALLPLGRPGNALLEAIAEGELPATGDPYDIRSAEAMAYAEGRRAM